MSSASCVTLPMDNGFMRRGSMSSGTTDDSPFSSGLNTPVDEVLQPFNQVLVQGSPTTPSGDEFELVSCTPRPSSYEISEKLVCRPPTTPKGPRSLSKGFLKAKNFAQSLGKGSSKKSGKKVKARPPLQPPSPTPASRVAESSPPTSSPSKTTATDDLLEQFPRRIFSIPNCPIGEEIIISQEPAVHNEDTALLSSPIIDDVSPVTAHVVTSHPSSASIHNPIAAAADEVKTTITVILQVIFFLPWCVAVGGCILLCPAHLDFVTFQYGLLPSPSGIRRFAHWADVAPCHVSIFLACIFGLGYLDKGLGVIVGMAVLAGVVDAWWDFRVDKTIPLGEDDMQSLWLVLWGRGMDEEGITIKRASGDRIAVKFDEGDEKGSTQVQVRDD